MFDSVLSKSGAPQSNVAGLGLTLVVCGLVAGAVAVLPSAGTQELPKSVDVTFVSARASAPPPPPPPPPPAGGGAATTEATPKQKQQKPKRDPLTLQSTEAKREPEKVPEPEPEPAQPEPETAAPSAPGGEPGGVAGGVVGGVAGGVVGGVAGGTVGGVVGGVPGGGGNAAVPFGPGMTRPEQVSGDAPSYTREAIAARVEGKVLVRCIITTHGEVRDCKVIKPLPMLDEVVLTALQTSRFTPVTYQGRPEAVQYLFTFNFKLP